MAAMWQRYVAVGDSFTEGMSDPDPRVPDRYVGWADRLAVTLADRAAQADSPFAYANLAVRGRLLDDVVGPQLDAALAMKPDLVSIVGGGNDLLRPGVDVDSIAERLEGAVARIRATGADVLMATPTDTRHAGLFKALRSRHAVHSANVFSIAQRHGAHVLNLWGLAAIQDWRMWGEDRIHLTSEGHRRVALLAETALGLRDPEASLDQEWRLPLPPQDPGARLDALKEHGEWAKAHLAPWVQRRLRGESSGDTVSAKRPDLAPVEALDPRP